MNPAIKRLVDKHLGVKKPTTNRSKAVTSHQSKLANKTIEESTPIIPVAMAESVVNKAARLLDEDLQNTNFAEILASHAETIFKHNPDFRKKVKANNGREYLWNFMQHWLTSELMKSGRYDKHKLRRVLIQGGFSLGRDVY
jgi:hypothetical protein